VFGLAWLVLVLTIFRHEHTPLADRLGRFDWWLRIAVIAVLVVLGVQSLAGDGVAAGAPWLAAKLLVFAAIVACGLTIRKVFAPFGPAFGRLLREGSTPAIEAELAAVLTRVRPVVVTLWIGLLVEAFLGIAKPF
jgi:hypothetical protein